MELPSALLSTSLKKKIKTLPRKNFLYFRKRNFLAPRLKNSVYFRKWNSLAPRLKNSLYFRKWNFLAKIKKILIFSQKSFSWISGNETFFKKTSYISGRNFWARKIKKPALEKFIKFSQNMFFLHFGKWNFLLFSMKRFSCKRFAALRIEKFRKIKKNPLWKNAIFWEMELSSHKLKKNSYISGGKFKVPSLNFFFILYFLLVLQEFLKINLYILHHNILHQNYNKKLQ